MPYTIPFNPHAPRPEPVDTPDAHGLLTKAARALLAAIDRQADHARLTAEFAGDPAIDRMFGSAAKCEAAVDDARKHLGFAMEALYHQTFDLGDRCFVLRPGRFITIMQALALGQD